MLAVQLFSEIERICGRELAPVTIYCAPTIAALAAILDEPAPPRFPPLLQLKDGVEAPPIFLAHGLGGTAMDFFQLVKHIQTHRPIYGMQAKGTDGVDEPFDRIEDLAQFHLDAIKKLQPHGPYYLIGYSLGGLVTFEMAQRLTKSGEKIALLAMLESYPHPRFLSFSERVRLGARLATQRASTVGRLPIRVRSHTSFALRNAGCTSLVTATETHPARYLLVHRTLRRCNALGNALTVLIAYRPRFYGGNIKFVRAETLRTSPRIPSQSGLAWLLS